MPKLIASALSGYLVPVGALAGALSIFFRMPISLAIGVLGTLISRRYVRTVTASHREFEEAFGPNWDLKIPLEIAARMLERRWNWWLPVARRARWQRDVPYWEIPGTDRKLLCDIWQPPQGITPSGLALIYLHGGYWHYFDKDSGTRPLFRHLAGQGHVVMDVSYRLSPEVDIRGMMGDVARAIAWMKRCGPEYGVDPNKVVVAGGSAGAHLAMLAAYAPGHPMLTPDDVGGGNLSVRGLVSYYGPPDLRPPAVEVDATLVEGPAQTEQAVMELEQAWGELTEALPSAKTSGKNLSHEEMMRNLLGGSFQEVPEMYSLASPITHVHPGCPPTLLFQGEHDSLVSVESARALHGELVEAGVTVIYREFPMTEHAFDLVLPQISPPAQSSIYDLDRFLGLMAG